MSTTTRINFKVPALDLDGKEIVENNETVILSKVLSGIIITSSINDEPLKFFDWAIELRQTGVLTLDDTDKDKLLNFIKTSDRANILVKGRLMKAINNAKSGTTETKPASTGKEK